MIASVSAIIANAPTFAADAPRDAEIRRVVDDAVEPLLVEHDIPGMAVAVTLRGERRVFNFGVASKADGRKVDDDTIFEIGSVSKTFTATLAAFAEAKGMLAFSELTSARISALSGSAFDRISLLELGTYTAGGLPLQFPDRVSDDTSMIRFYRDWRPAFAPGAYRQYSNPSIGLFGHIAAGAMGAPFEQLMEGTLFPILGLGRTTVSAPEAHMADYAFGYAKDGRPIRVSPGVLAAEAYGVRTTATDMLRFVELNMDSAGLDETLRRAIAMTQTGYVRVGDMTQGLGWEFYDYPVGLDRLLAGNSAEMIQKANTATRLDPPRAPRADVLINKTGSTNGFGAYVAFVPAKRVGIVMLANRNYPIPARVKAAYRILEGLIAATDR